ncbi:substrate-binding domain-containing protein [Leifsonia sp. NPDC080035]|uniref:Substrate-binding domain-containing protein n=1 Tax=Leifsonia sp. NPDC080035 TaxID=3143936 RepID=A0AAU7G6H6_9MICO
MPTTLGRRRHLIDLGHTDARPHGVGDWTAASGYEFGRTFPVAEPFTAAFIANDAMAVGFIGALAERGYDVLRDVSVVGFDDVPEAQFLRPGLTTVRQDFGALGEAALTVILEVLDGPGTGRSPAPLEPTLVERGSSARVAGSRDEPARPVASATAPATAHGS